MNEQMFLQALEQSKPDRLEGGKGDKKNLRDFDLDEAIMGLKVEREHAKDLGLRAEITADHLEEKKDYYTRLRRAGLADELEKNAQVEPYQQKTQWTCSAACLRAVCKHWGFDAKEIDFVEAIGTRPKGGAETHDIAEGARKLGFAAFEFSFDSLDQTKVLLEPGVPIICDIQSFKHPGSGHYVVLTNIDDQGVHLMDPNVEGNHRVISPEEMEERWWDREMAPPHKVMRRWGVVVLPPEDHDGNQ